MGGKQVRAVAVMAWTTAATIFWYGTLTTVFPIPPPRSWVLMLLLENTGLVLAGSLLLFGSAICFVDSAGRLGQVPPMLALAGPHNAATSTRHLSHAADLFPLFRATSTMMLLLLQMSTNNVMFCEKIQTEYNGLSSWRLGLRTDWSNRWFRRFESFQEIQNISW